jgi:hypothetical protein
MNRAIEIFTSHKGTLKTSQAIALGISPRTRSTHFMAVSKFCLSQTCSHSPVFGFPSSRAGVGSALWSVEGSFTSRLCPVVSISWGFCLPCSSRKLL